MKSAMKKMMGALAMATIGSFASAATLSAVPSMASVNIGSIFSVTINVGDLVDGAAPSLGAFDLDIHFDANVLNYSGFSWGDSVHGDQLDLAQLGSINGYDASLASTGALNFYEISLDDSAVLNTLQAGDFGLLTLNFSALNVGVSSLSLSVNSLSDAEGFDLAAQIHNGEVAVSAVPLPGTLPLLVSALLLAAGRGRNRSV